MKIKTSTLSTENTKANFIAIPISNLNSKELAAIDKKHSLVIKSKIKLFGFKAEKQARLEINLDSAKENKTIKLYSLSSLDQLSPENHDEWRKLGGDTLQSAKRNKAKTVTVSLHAVNDKILSEVTEAIVEGILLSNYEFKKYQKNKKAEEISVELLISGKQKKAVEAAIVVATIRAKATSQARDLVNIAPSDLQPKDVLAFAKTIKGSGISLKVFNRAALKKMKAFSLLGVARGSDAEPYLIHLSYKPKIKSKNRKVITLVGKGITFDTGGLSIKTGKGMEDMKCDMSGAACVLSVMKAISELPKDKKPKHEVNVIVPTCENMINGNSLKPGDVISAINGKTIEVLNTDAEGRLILADAFGYAEKLKSNLMIDLATLTGACIVALGSDYTGMFSTDQEYTKKLKTAFDKGGEKVWELPLAAEYRSQLNSPIADLKNIGDGGPGAITAALFLKEFVPANTPWIHLDIAGPAFTTKSNEYLKKGGTGYGVLSLLRFLDQG